MKHICVPKDQDALVRLDADRNIPGDLIEITLNDEDFNKLWEKGFFHSINIQTNSIIDDFEDEHILDECQLNKVVNSELFESENYEGEIFEVVREIKGLFEEALHRKTGIHFYF
ncbi:MAG: hypothetical protein JST50_12630 [Bacteroidetes bacterium]|jgi:hypothetical protein|nr:hypothetical protein [Bacteroidota bacterium]